MLEIPSIPIEDALYVCNHSGGKDSQAMYLLLSRIIPKKQLVVIHANLPGVEWEGVIDHIKNTINHELFVVQAKKTFFDMVDHRQMWPSPKNRQCTSDLKRASIDKKIREICNDRGFTKVVNCIGLRAEESSGRAKKEIFKKSKNSNSKRDWYEWLPIHKLTVDKVFDWIGFNYQKPHWAYAEGMSRLSCCFCIMSNKQDLKIAAKLNPELFNKYKQKEKEIDQTLFMPTKKGRIFLEDLINNEADKII